MQHIQVTFETADQAGSDMLIAMLAGIGYDGFEERDRQLLAYIEDTRFDPEELQAIAGEAGVAYTTGLIAAQNWNAIWESNFEPVVVDGLCTIRAHFHNIVAITPYEIIITPKMSFGTGHHATTQLVMMMMQHVQLQDKRVLDFGTGTGVLAILAEMLGAAAILAIDNDEWSVTNAIENAARNSCRNITIAQGGLEDVAAGNEDVILANINRHILLQYMDALYARLNEDGTIIMSGLLTDDKEIMLAAAGKAGFVFKEIMELNNWIALKFTKSN